MAVRHVVDRIAFEVPDDLEDATTYAFASEDDEDELTVVLEVPAAAATPAAEVAAQVREGLTLTFPENVEALDERETTLDGRPARSIDYTVRGCGDPVFGCTVIAEREGGGFVKIDLRAREADRLRDRLLPVLDTVSLTGADRAPPAGEGYRRARLGPLALHVPTELHGPLQRLFIDGDDRLRLQVVVRPLGKGAAALDRAVTRDGRGGWTVLDREDQSWARGQWCRYRRISGNQPPREQSVARAVVAVPLAPVAKDPAEPEDPAVQHVEIHGTTEPGRARALHGALDVVLRSLGEAR